VWSPSGKTLVSPSGATSIRFGSSDRLGRNDNVRAAWQNGSMATKTAFGTTLLVRGSESLLAERAVAAQVARARRERPNAEVTEVTADALADGRFADLVGGSLFASDAVVVVTDLANLPDQALPLVKQTALAPHDELCLVLVHGGGIKGKALLDALKKAGVTTEYAEPVKPWELPKFIAAEARLLRMGLDNAAGQALIEAVGTDLRSLSAALRQLASDYDGEQVSAAMVQRYFGGRAEVTSFAVADDALSGRQGSALEKLRWALSTGVSPVLVTSALASSLRALGKYLELRSGRFSDQDLARQVGVPPFKLKEFNRLSRDWSGHGVSVAIRAVAKADEQVKGAAADPGFALEQLLLAVAAARSR